MSATSATNIMSALEVKDFQLTSPPCVEEKQPFGLYTLSIHVQEVYGPNDASYRSSRIQFISKTNREKLWNVNIKIDLE